MKKLLLLMLVIMTLSACGNKTEKLTIRDFIAPKADSLYVYEGDENHLAAWNVFYDYIDMEKGYIQQRLQAGQNMLAELLKIENGALKVVGGAYEYDYTDDLRKYPPATGIVILQEPLVLGQKWELIPGICEAEITSMDKEITVPYGNLNTMEVTYTYTDYVRKDYYAKGLGLVLIDTIQNQKSVTTSLASIEPDFAFSRPVYFFYPNSDIDGLDYEIREISTLTNVNMEELFTEMFKQYGEGITPVFTSGVKINSLSLDLSTLTLKVDLNKAFLTEMNAGVAYEGHLLSSIVNTLGHYYSVTDVNIRIDGGPYESGHVILGLDETLPVDYEFETESE